MRYLVQQLTTLQYGEGNALVPMATYDATSHMELEFYTIASEWSPDPALANTTILTFATEGGDNYQQVAFKEGAKIGDKEACGYDVVVLDTTDNTMKRFQALYRDDNGTGRADFVFTMLEP